MNISKFRFSNIGYYLLEFSRFHRIEQRSRPKGPLITLLLRLGTASASSDYNKAS